MSNTEDVFLKYPSLFPQEVYLAVPEYWRPVLDSGFARLDAILKNPDNIIDVQDWQDSPRCVEVKEKYNTLRVYMNYYNAEICQIIKQMETEIELLESSRHSKGLVATEEV